MHDITLVYCSLPQHIVSRIKVECLMQPFAISAIEAQAQAQIESQVVCNAPVILEVRFHNLVAVVVLEQVILLSETRNLPQQQIRKRVAGGTGHSATAAGRRQLRWVEGE